MAEVQQGANEKRGKSKQKKMNVRVGIYQYGDIGFKEDEE